MHLIRPFSLLIILASINCLFLTQTIECQALWFSRPALDWESEALPIGNGRLGAMLFGGIDRDVIQFNEQSLWSGDNDWDGEYLTGDHGFGSYRNFGEIIVDFAGKDSSYSIYTRSLDINKGIHSTEFVQNYILHNREAFASYPDQVIVFKYSSSKNESLSGVISLFSAQGASSIASGTRLSFTGEMANGLKYSAIIQIVNEDGKIKIKENSLEFEKCSSITLLLAARTDYKPDYSSGWRGSDPLPLIEIEVAKAASFTYNELVLRHISDFTRLSKAAVIDIGSTETETLSLTYDLRLMTYNQGGYDPDLEEMMFQYGRYLLISSSRPGGLPANLQGLWNNSNTPPWASDYHSNINLQMNYWLAGPANLQECNLPLLDFLDACREPCRIATRRVFGEDIRGWTARTSQSIFGGNGWG